MSVQITTAFVEQYRSNVYHLLQQKGSRLRKAVDTTTVVGKNAFFDQIGSTEAVEAVTRHDDTPRMDTPHARRRVTLRDFRWSDLIDDEDQIRMLIDPAGPYAEAAAMALGRKMDDVIIEAATGTAYTGVAGGTSTAFDTNMIVDVQVRWAGVSADDCGLNIAKLLEAGELLAANNVDPDEEKWCIVNARQVNSLLQDTRISSFDYNSVKPLVDGKIGRAAGFNLISTQRIGTDGNGDDKVLFWTKGGMKLAIGKDIGGRVSERPDKNYATQIYNSMTIGATRMEEGRVGYIECDPDAGPEGNLD